MSCQLASLVSTEVPLEYECICMSLSKYHDKISATIYPLEKSLPRINCVCVLTYQKPNT